VQHRRERRRPPTSASNGLALTPQSHSLARFSLFPRAQSTPGLTRATPASTSKCQRACERSQAQLSCTQDGQTLHCDEFDAPVGDDGSGTATFIADTSGSYTFVVSLDHLSAADPNLADNRDSITVPVGEKPVDAGPVSIRPAPPHAGQSFVASFLVTGAAVDSVHCKTSIGTAAARRSSQRASCVIRAPRSARGRVLRGSVIATVGTHTFLRRYTVRLR
jgi:hypothetical protein